MKIIDISWPITEQSTEYKDKKTVKFTHIKTFTNDSVRESTVCFSSHTGTHIDAPAHFLSNGKTIDQLDLQQFIGSCSVLDFTHITDKISDTDLQKHSIVPDQFILLKTKNSFLLHDSPFNYNFIYLDSRGAQYLVDKKIKGVGIDYLGIERDQPGHPTHKLLLSHEISLIEGLRLASVSPKDYFLYCLPIYTIGLEAAPARAILVER